MLPIDRLKELFDLFKILLADPFQIVQSIIKFKKLRLLGSIQKFNDLVLTNSQAICIGSIFDCPVLVNQSGEFSYFESRWNLLNRKDEM
jgi:hypothetical protein